MELVNTHCHCVYSGHGIGSIAEYADAAAAAGLTTLAFTEHFPLSEAFDPDEYLSMRPPMVDAYLAEIDEARARHPQIEFVSGTEMDYLGALEDRQLTEDCLLYTSGPGRAAPGAFQKVESGAPHPVQGVGVGVHGEVGRTGHLEGRHGAGRLGAQGGGGGVVQVGEVRRLSLIHISAAPYRPEGPRPARHHLRHRARCRARALPAP